MMSVESPQKTDNIPLRNEEKSQEDKEKKKKEDEIRLIKERTEKIVELLDKEESGIILNLSVITRERLQIIRNILEDINDKLTKNTEIIKVIKSSSSLNHEMGNFQNPVLIAIERMKKLNKGEKDYNGIQRVIDEKTSHFYNYLTDIVKDEESFKKAITLEDWPFEEAA